jgi:hypothetical protein
MIRTVGIFAGTANVACKAVYDYAVQDRQAQPPLITVTNPGIWDSAIWDLDIWDYETEGQNFLGGAYGIGRAFAVLCVGNAASRVNIVGWDLSFRVGGYL